MKSILKTPRSLLNNRGASLIELLMYMGLLAMILTVLTQLFASSVENMLESDSTASIDQDSAYIFLQLEKSVRGADVIVSPALYGEPAGTELQVEYPDATTATFELQGENLIKTVDSQSNQINSNATRVTEFLIEKIGQTGGYDTVQVTITLVSRTTSNRGQETKTFQTTLGTRKTIVN